MKDNQVSILKEFMSSIAPDKTVFIGAASGYLFIGDLKAYKADFPKLEEEADKALKKSTESANKLIHELNKKIDEENEHADGALMPKIQNELFMTKKTLSEREIIETYEKILDGEESGLAVIIKGSEHGKYWFKREYDKKMIQPDDEVN